MDMNEQIEAFKEFFDDNYKNELYTAVMGGKRSLSVDFGKLAEYNSDLAELLLQNPEDLIKAGEFAIEHFDLPKPTKHFRVRYLNLPVSQRLRIADIRSEHLGRFIWFESIVRQSSDIRPQVTNAKFECAGCGNTISILQIDTKFKEPSRCTCGWRGKFRLLSKDLVDVQHLKVEEVPESLEGGEQPKRLSIFLQEDLVEAKMEKRTAPGAKILVFGIVKEIPIPLKTGAQSTRYDIVMEANNIVPVQEDFSDLVLNEKDIKEIVEFSKDPKIYEKFTKAIAPSIYGHEKIKQALILQLVGGVRKVKEDKTVIRGDIHILLVGDPGAGKSALLSFIAKAAPKARFVSGKGSTGTGLTAAVVKDEFLKGWSLEAGALVLANKGIAVVDELDKMTDEDRSALHEALEQQCMLPDFKLMLSNGTSVKIGNFVDNLINLNKEKVYAGKDCEILQVDNVELLSTNFINHFPVKAARVSRHIAPKDFVKIELTNGKQITVTPEHPCWVVDNGKITTIPAEKLTADMYFPIPSKLKINTIPYNSNNNTLCKILGYHLSDGCYELNRGKKVGIQFWNNDEILIKDYKESIEKYFNVKPGITKRKHQFAVRVISKKVFEEIRAMGGNLIEKGDTKKIPDSVMQFPNENLKYLLAAIYDGDGTVVFQKRNGCRVSLVSQNRELMEQVSDLLLRFGIQSSIFKDRSVWKLDTSGQENLSKFLLNITFLSKHKQKRLEEYCSKDKTYRSIKDVVPNCTNKINKIFKELKISARKQIGHSIDLGVEKHRLFLQKLVRIAINEAMQIEGSEGCRIRDEIHEIEKLAFGYARWMKIKKVSKLKNEGIKWVYDVTVEPYHTFISNGMILHNTVTISKANIQASLRAETTMLAAANPKLGRFDPYAPIAAQIDLPSTLINRFDLIFPIRDIPNKDKDEKIALHVLEAIHKEETYATEVTPQFLKKYLAYVKMNVYPKMTKAAINEIKDFYVNLRNSGKESDEGAKPIPISARQLEALIRLSEASARMRLDSKVTKDDAVRGIELLKHCLMQVGFDPETGQIDIDRIASGITASTRNRIGIIKDIVEELTRAGIKEIPIDELIAKAVSKGIEESKVEEVLEQLSRNGEIFEPKRGFIKKV